MNIPNDPKEVLEMAVNNEREAYELLCASRDACEDKLSKATFDFLAKEELKHIDVIQKFGETGVASAPDVSKSLTKADVAKGIKGIFEQFGWQYEQAAATDDRMEAYRTAMDMERHGHQFYAKAAEVSTNPEAKKFFEFLAREEVRHFEIIQDSYDFLSEPDAMLAMEERWMQT
jgi:rubrerythrin